MSDSDLIVLGGGAAGLAAARAGVRHGARTLLISDGPPGGDCTFTGCVPSKALIAAAREGRDFAAARRRVHASISTVAAGEDAAALRAEGIEVATGRARFTGPRRLRVEGATHSADRVVVATGGGPWAPPVDGLAAADPLTNETVFDLTELPGSLAVLGGGAIGCELAQAFARLGSRVTLIETAERLLPTEDPEASAVIAAVFAREGIDVRVGARVDAVTAGPGTARLSLAGGSEVLADRVLVATGRRPGTEDLGLDAAGVEVDERGYIRTDRFLATTADGVHAAGDVTGRMPFTHAADEMGRLAVDNAMRTGLDRRRHAYGEHATPRVVFTDPEVAQVGRTAAQAATLTGARAAYLPLSELDRAITDAGTDGFLRLIAGPRRVLRDIGGGRLLGATIVAARAGEMIHEPTLAMGTGMFTGRLAATTHAYPSWSTGVQQTAAQFFMTIGGRRARPLRR